MTFQLLINEAAQQEWNETAAWYERRQPGLGERFIKSVEIKLELISRYPERYPKRKWNFRETPVGIFPFNIVYSFYKKEGIVTVASIFHTRRNPAGKYKK